MYCINQLIHIRVYPLNASWRYSLYAKSGFRFRFIGVRTNWIAVFYLGNVGSLIPHDNMTILDMTWHASQIASPWLPPDRIIAVFLLIIYVIVWRAFLAVRSAFATTESVGICLLGSASFIKEGIGLNKAWISFLVSLTKVTFSYLGIHFAHHCHNLKYPICSYSRRMANISICIIIFILDTLMFIRKVD